jgi:hypothetical protein
VARELERGVNLMHEVESVWTWLWTVARGIRELLNAWDAVQVAKRSACDDRRMARGDCVSLRMDGNASEDAGGVTDFFLDASCPRTTTSALQLDASSGVSRIEH